MVAVTTVIAMSLAVIYSDNNIPSWSSCRYYSGRHSTGGPTSGCGPGLLWVMVSVEVSQQQEEEEKGKCFTTVRGACKTKWVFPDREPGIRTYYTSTEYQLIATSIIELELSHSNNSVSRIIS